MPRLKTICCLFALLLVASVGFGAAPKLASPIVNKLVPITPVGPSPITPDCRYLFVVETSAAMQRSADGLYRTTHRLVATGLGGRMQEGNVFTVWTYADTVLTREFPLNAWTPDLNIALANRAYEFLAQQKFRGKSNLRPVFAELGQALAIATNLTVILISDGTDVIVGTPFDRPINVTYGKRANEMRSTKMPFITALVTQRGEFTHWAVRGGLEDVGLPIPEKSVVPLPVFAQTPAVVPPAPIPLPVVTPPPVATPVTTPKVVVATNAPTPIVVASAPKPPAPAPPVLISTNLVAAKPPEVAVPKPTPPPTPVPTPPKPIEPVSPVASAKKVEAAPTTIPQPAKPSNTLPLPPLPLPVPSPKENAKVNPPPPPKPVAEPPKAQTPTPTPTLTKPKEELVTPAIPPVIPPALRQPSSVTDASNALAKVELLRPPTATSAPPAKPLEARVVETKPPLPKLTNATVIAAKPAPPVPTAINNSPAVKPVTNTSTIASTSPKTIPIVVPTNALKQFTKSPELKVAPSKPAANALALTSNTTVALVLPLPKGERRGEGKGVVVSTVPGTSSPKPPLPDAKRVSPTPEGKTNATAAKPAKPAGQLAVASPATNKGGWAYLAAAVALLVVAGSIIAHLLRPRPNPSVISQSLDDQRV